MADRSAIEWTDSTLNPWVGCTKISPACDHCYAAVATPSRTLGVEWGAGKPRHRTSAANWNLPLRWNAQPFYACACGYRGTMHDMTTNAVHGCGLQFRRVRRRVFCASLADVFDNEVDPKWRADLFALIEKTPNLDWLLLTKRIGNVATMAPASWLGGPVQHGPDPTNMHGGWPANVWLGATVCNQAEADRDVPKLLRVPAAVRFLSVEPMLGPVDIRGYMWPVCGWWVGRHKSYAEAKAAGAECGLKRQSFVFADARHIDWVITGGESGSHARPSHPEWFRSLRDQCAAAGVPFLFKQWGEWAPGGSFASHIPGSTSCDFDGTLNTDEDRVWRVGKKAAGRTLDGVQHDGYPEHVPGDSP